MSKTPNTSELQVMEGAYVAFEANPRPSPTHATFLDLTEAALPPREEARGGEDGEVGPRTIRLLRLSALSRLTRPSRVYVTLAVTSSVLLAVVGVTIVASTATRKIIRTIDDVTSPCAGVSFDDSAGTLHAAGYQTSLILVGAALGAWNAFRCVVLEKEGTLVAYVVIVAVTLARALYVVFVKSLTWYRFDATLTMVLRLMTGFSLCAWIASLFSARFAVGTFGYRRYFKGVTQMDEVDRLRRSTHLEATTHVDVYVSVAVVLSIAFLSDSTAMKTVGACAGVGTVGVLLGMWRGMKGGGGVAVGILFATLGGVLPGMAVVVAVENAGGAGGMGGACVTPANVADIPPPPHPANVADIPPPPHPANVADIPPPPHPANVADIPPPPHPAPCPRPTLARESNAATECCEAWGRTLGERENRAAERVPTAVLAGCAVGVRIAVAVALWRVWRVMPQVRDAIRRGDGSTRRYFIEESH